MCWLAVSVGHRSSRARLNVFNKLVLTPIGDGSTAHIGQDVPIPGRLELQVRSPAGIALPASLGSRT